MMTESFEVGDAVLFMKIGTHANEELADIIARKKREIEAVGFAMWGYGGGTCHPSTTVQPFARARTAQAGRIILCMQPMVSRHFAEPVRAEEYSEDGLTWSAIPSQISVLGSRYALFIRDLREVDATLSLGSTRVASGRSMGKTGNDYVKGRVDKACLEVVSANEDPSPAEIGLVAQVIEPFAVFLRN